MECKNCGYHFKKGEEVCPYCGASAQEMMPPPPAQQVVRVVYEQAPPSPPPQREEYASARSREAEEQDQARRIKRYLWLALTAVVIIVCIAVSVSYNEDRQKAAASAYRSSTAAIKSVHIIGESAELGGVQFTVVKAQKLTNIQLDRPEKGNEFVAVTITIHNGTPKRVEVSAIDFRMRDGSGEYRHYADTMFQLDNEITTVQVESSQSVTGTVVFEEPIGSSLTLQYIPLVDGQTLEFKII